MLVNTPRERGARLKPVTSDRSPQPGVLRTLGKLRDPVSQRCVTPRWLCTRSGTTQRCVNSMQTTMREPHADSRYPGRVMSTSTTIPADRSRQRIPPTRRHVYPGGVNAVDRHRWTRCHRTPSGTRRIERAERFVVRANTRQTATCGNCSIEHGVSHLRRRRT